MVQNLITAQGVLEVYSKYKTFIEIQQNKKMIKHIKLIETILFVENQETSCMFYQRLFRKEADLNVPGMTEFNISETCKIGIMPNKGITTILEGKISNITIKSNIAKCELYLYVDNIQFELENAIKAGAKLLSPISKRNWGDNVCYFSDPDGYIIAFAEK